MNDMKTLVLLKLKEHKGQLSSIAETVDIPYPTLLKIGQGVIKNPGIDHMQVLYDYFYKEQKAA
jgi:predicted transcriptional regulator